MVLSDGRLEPKPIGEVVRDQVPASVVSFDPETFEVGYHEITGWYEGPADRIFEVRLASGRSVRVTAGHNLFTLGPDGELTKTRTGALRSGTRVAIPARIPDPAGVAPEIRVLDCVPESARSRITVTGPTVAAAFRDHDRRLRDLFVDVGNRHFHYYRDRSRLPLAILDRLSEDALGLGPQDRLALRGSPSGISASITVDGELAWMLGLYVAEGSRRANQFTISNTDQSILDRVISVLERLGISTLSRLRSGYRMQRPVIRAPQLDRYRRGGAFQADSTCCLRVAARPAREFLRRVGGRRRIP